MVQMEAGALGTHPSRWTLGTFPYSTLCEGLQSFGSDVQPAG